MAGDRAEIRKGANVHRMEDEGTAGTRSVPPLRAGMKIRDDNIMFYALTVDQRHQDDVTLAHSQGRVGLPVDCSVLTDKDDFAVGNTGKEPKARIRDAMGYDSTHLFCSCGGRQQPQHRYE